MKKETLIQKWLDNELSAAELEAFGQLEEADDYIKLSETATYFKAAEFDTAKNYEHVQGKLKRHKKSTLPATLLKIAAVFVIAFGTYFTFFQADETHIVSLAGATEKVSLPDGSKVLLNAVSSLDYDEASWKKNREVHLQGEAFFKVEKGKRFDVITPAGTISVLGTQFNIKQREGYFEVTCYEGLVSVKTLRDSILLPAGKSYRFLENIASHGVTGRLAPSWTKDVSSFQSVPFKDVIAEFERQYKLNIHLKSLTFDTDQLFTGSFAHNHLETALKSISIPFNLSYTVKDDTVILKVRD